MSTAAEPKPLARVEITRPMQGIFSMQVCAEADATDEEILAVCNQQNPSGTSNGWCSVVRNTGDNRAPVVCADHPDRLHFLVDC